MRGREGGAARGWKEVEQDMCVCWGGGRGGVPRRMIHSSLALLMIQKQSGREKNVLGNISPMQVSLGVP